MPSWVLGLVWQAYRTGYIVINQLPLKPTRKDASALLGRNLDLIWKRQLAQGQNKNAPLARALFQAHGRSLILSSLVSLFAEFGCKSLAAYSVGQMLHLLSERDSPMNSKLQTFSDPNTNSLISSASAQSNYEFKLNRDVKYIQDNDKDSRTDIWEQISRVLASLIRRTSKIRNPETDTGLSLECWAITLVLSVFAWALTAHLYGFQMMRLALHVRVGCSHLIHAKALKLPIVVGESSPAGQVFNLISNDLDKFNNLFVLLPFAWVGPMQTVLALILLWPHLGPAALCPVMLVLLLIPCQMLLSNSLGRARHVLARLSDARLALIAETLASLKLTKLYAWQAAMRDRLYCARAKECKQLNRVAVIRATIYALMYVSSKLLLFVAILGHCIVLGKPLDAHTLFMSMALLNNVQFTVGQLLPRMLTTAADALVSLGRIQTFLLLPEPPMSSSYHLLSESNQVCVECDQMSICMHDNDVTLNEQKKEDSKMIKEKDIDPSRIILRSISFSFRAEKSTQNENNNNLGSLLVVCGPSASGKSSLLLSLLNEFNIISGNIKLSDSLSYCPQEAWVFGASLRDNITFGRTFKPRRYLHVLKACQLEQDIEQMKHKDLTWVQSNLLSGGQRARLNLARCLYKRADIYLLDDCLAALDERVQDAIMDEAIGWLLRSGKLVILVTNKLQLCLNADKIALLDHGKLLTFGSKDQVANELQRDKQNANHFSRQVLEILQSKTQKQRFRNCFMRDHSNKSSKKLIKTNDSQSKLSNIASAISDNNYENDKKQEKHDSFPDLGLLDHESNLKARLEDEDESKQKNTNSDERHYGNEEYNENEHDFNDKDEIYSKLKSIGEATDNYYDNYFGIDANRTTNKYRRFSRIWVHFHSLASKFCIPMIVITFIMTQILFSTVDVYLTVWSLVEQNKVPYGQVTSNLNLNLSSDSDLDFDSNQMYDRHNSHMSGHSLDINNDENEGEKKQFNLVSSDSQLIANAGVHSKEHLSSVRPFYRPLYSRLENMDSVSCATLYGLLLLALFLCSLLANLISLQATIISATKLYQRMVDCALNAKMSFFDEAKHVDEYITRASRDLAILDEQIPQVANQAYESMLMTVGALLIVAIVNPTLALPSVFLMIFYLTIRHIHVVAAKDIQRLECSLRSPVLGHVASTLSGLTTIRASNRQDHQQKLFEDHIDRHSAVFLLYFGADRLLAVTLDLMNSAYVSLVVIYIIFDWYAQEIKSDSSGPSAGLTITSAMILSGLTQHGLMKLTETEAFMTSAERIIEYSELPQEVECKFEQDNHNNQSCQVNGSRISMHDRDTFLAPFKGQLEYNQVTFSYDKLDQPQTNEINPIEGDRDSNIQYNDIDSNHKSDLQLQEKEFVQLYPGQTSSTKLIRRPVLSNIVFKVRPGEKIGLIGRTGSGKSSLVATLFRLYDYEGQILIDQRDTKTISLNTLRSKIGIIPQQPILFTGTIRFNLDPCSLYSDSDLWSALEKANLRSVVANLPNKLEYNIIGTSSDSVGPLSAGQRQLICLARVLLKHDSCKLIVLDEATASVDGVTESLIQTTIKREFESATVLTIAHRLDTIKDSDRIMILDTGRLVHFDTPENLLNDGKNYYAQMMLNRGCGQRTRNE